MGLFSQMGDMYKLQKEAKKIKKELSKTYIYAEEKGIKITVNGEQRVVSVEIQDESILLEKKSLEKAIMEAMNRAMKKAQEVAAEKMKSVMGGFPGLGQ